MSALTYVPVGIDISKKSFNVAFLKGNKRSKSAQFNNREAGFEQLSQWFKQQGLEQVHACLEATNIYGHALASYLYAQGHRVSIVNPARVKGYAQSQLIRTKNDRADAGLIARFCRDLTPSLWRPSPAEVAKLQALSRRLEALEKMVSQEKNRQQLCEDQFLSADIQAHLDFLRTQEVALKKQLQAHIQAHESLAQQQSLLVSIVGIGEKTAMGVLGEIGSIEGFESARQLASYAGLTPREFTSGSSINGKTRLCKIGNSHLRKLLYFPALSAIRHSPEIKAFRARLLAAGKTKMQVVGAVMHKLLRVIYGVLKSGQPFDPKKLNPTQDKLTTAEPAAALALAS